MTNLTIFKDSSAVAKAPQRQSALGAQIAENMGGFNRIQTNTNGTFKRIVNGEQIGKPIRGEFNAIIVAMLAKPGREYYAGKYDPDAKGTLPDCFSNLGDKPEERAGKKQSPNCATCPKNVDGTGENGRGKACRFKRKIAVLLEGDDSGDVYQLNVPAKSLFGKGVGNTHPYESYCRFLVANGTAPDLVVTTIAYNLDADTMEINFTPVRPVTEEELVLIEDAQRNPATQRLIQITVGEGERQTAKAAEPQPEPEARKPRAVQPVVDEDEDEDEAAEAPAEPVKRASAKRTEPKPAGDLSSTMNAWLNDDEDDD